MPCEVKDFFNLINIIYMTHSLLNAEMQTEITIEETTGKTVLINVYDLETKAIATHYLNKQQLHDFIGVLLHVQAKIRK